MVKSPDLLLLVESAYAKLKTHIYNDYTNLFVRSKIAKFESSPDFFENLEKLSFALSQYRENGSSDHIAQLINEIDFKVLPKKFNGYSNGSRGQPFLISNEVKKTSYPLEKSMYVIDCPVEIHIISVLWTIHLGFRLDNDLLSSDCYGNRLEKNDIEEVNKFSKKLFKPYYQNYKNWRDNGLEVARQLHSKNIDSIVLTLDIKNYFYNIDLDLSILEEFFKIEDEESLFLNNILNSVHKKYKEKLSAKNNLVPIGLLSSGVIGNFALSEADRRIRLELKPAYYGRYVDDFIIVLPNITTNNSSSLKEWLQEILKYYPIFISTDESDTGIKLSSSYGNFFIQFDKVRIINLLATQPLNVLSEFENNIKKTASEARLLVEDADLLSKFDAESAKISYSESIYKLRSIDAFNMNKLGASSYLTNLIEATKLTDRVSYEDSKKFHSSVLSYFRGNQGLESYHLWEKVITFYVIQNKMTYLFEFVDKLVDDIFRIELGQSYNLPFETDNKKLREESKVSVAANMLTWISEALRLAVALNSSVLLDKKFQEFLKRVSSSNILSIQAILKQIVGNIFSTKNLVSGIKAYRSSNMLRHKYVTAPLTNYCDQGISVSLTDNDYKKLRYKLNKRKIRFSPRFIQFHEIQIFMNYRFFAKGIRKPTIEGAKKRYIRINYLKNYKHSIFKDLQKKVGSDSNEAQWPIYSVGNQRRLHDTAITIGVANIRIFEANAADAIRGNPNLDYDRLTYLNRILNHAVHEKVQLMLLPEMAIPLEWIDYVSRFCQKHFLGLITGIEHHIVSQGQVANLVCHILPFETDGRKNTLVTFRNKQDYSPEEKNWIASLGLSQFRNLDEQCIYDWCGLHFATFNCFEVTDLKKRAALVGNVDLVNIVENNKDTEYFSNIVESTSRDVHSIVAQVNNSDYGDSRVCIPAKSFHKDQLRIRGGKNPTILVEELDVHSLRLYQAMGEAAKNIRPQTQIYKPVPPNFKLLPTRKVPKVNPKVRK